ncbi:MAG: pentapeptide repeat-containing protein [Lachnospiraceae bacterium]|jgi:uncharacterized protein YjbI with pentapeptide repeats
MEIGLRQVSIDDIEKLISEEEVIQNCLIKDQILENLDKKIFISNCVVENVTFLSCNLYEADFYKTKFVHCDMSNLYIPNAAINNCIFENCKMIGVNISESSLNEVQLDNVIGGYMNATGAIIKKCTFTKSDFKNAFFNNCDLKKNILEQCNLKKAWFNGVMLRGVDFSTCDIEGINVGVKEIQGMKVSTAQAVELIRLLGVEIV